MGDIREDTSEKARSGQLEAGVAKADLLDYEINASLVEGEGVDLLAMGRPEGPGCYCAANTMLRTTVDRIAGSYECVVIDNEAGLEHLSRRTTRDVQHLLVVSDPTQRGIVAASRIASFRDELDIHIEHAYLILNRLPGSMPPALKAEIDKLDIPLLGIISSDDELSKFEFSGKPLVELGDDSPTYQAVAKMMSAIL